MTTPRRPVDAASQEAAETSYVVGIMKTAVEGSDTDFEPVLTAAIKRVEAFLTDHAFRLHLRLFDFVGPHLVPSGGAYAPLDFLQIGIAEKVERRLHFLLIVTEVDLSTDRSYTVALPSRLTNIGIVSTKRLMPRFWGQPRQLDVAVNRLTALLLHTIGHLLNLRHSDEPGNLMYQFQDVRDLERMTAFTSDQVDRMLRVLPDEAHEALAGEHRWRFVARQTFANRRSIARTVRRANPLSLIPRLPALIAAALSVDVFIFFTAEMWDASSSMGIPELLVFSLLSLAIGTAMLYRSFNLGTGPGRNRLLAESVVVTRAATIVTLLLTLLVLYTAFFFGAWAFIVGIFPRDLMATLPTAIPAVHTIDHVRLSMIVASMSILTGSLGGATESKDVIRRILFLDEET